MESCFRSGAFEVNERKLGDFTVINRSSRSEQTFTGLTGPDTVPGVSEVQLNAEAYWTEKSAHGGVLSRGYSSCSLRSITI